MCTRELSPFIKCVLVLIAYACIWALMCLCGTHGSTGGRLLGAPIGALMIGCMVWAIRSRRNFGSLLASVFSLLFMVLVETLSPDPLLHGFASALSQSTSKEKLTSYAQKTRTSRMGNAPMPMTSEDYASVFSDTVRFKAPQVIRTVVEDSEEVVFLTWGKGRLGMYYVSISNPDQSCDGVEVFEGVCAGMSR